MRQYENAVNILIENNVLNTATDLQLMLCDIYLDSSDSVGGNRRVLDEVVHITSAISDTSLTPFVSYYKSKALRRLQYYVPAEQNLNALLADSTSPVLNISVKYELARICEDKGDLRKAHDLFQEIYAKTPDFLDVSSRLAAHSSISQ